MTRRARSQHAALIAQLADMRDNAEFWRKSAEHSEAAYKAAERDLKDMFKACAKLATELAEHDETIKRLTFENNNLAAALLPDVAAPILHRAKNSTEIAPVAVAAWLAVA